MPFRSIPRHILAFTFVISIALAVISASIQADSGRSLVMLLAQQNRLSMILGTYDAKRGWLGLEGIDKPAQPGDDFTIYTMAGERAQVKVTDDYPSTFNQGPIVWSARTTTWSRDPKEPYALALPGKSPLAGAAAETIDLQSAGLAAEISAYLKKKGLDVPAPLITSAYQIDLSEKRPKATFVTAYSGERDAAKGETENFYALALLLERNGDGWQVYPLAEETSYKPKSQSMSDHKKYYGVLDNYRIIACMDLDGDGIKDLVLHLAKDDGTEVQIFTFKHRYPKQVLSVFRHHFND